MIKNFFFGKCLCTISFALLAYDLGLAQSLKALTLEHCHQLAAVHYPLAKQGNLLDKNKYYLLGRVSKRYLPQINIGGQASYQSTTTQIPSPVGNFDFTSVSKDQYRLFAEVSQPVTDLFVMQDQKKLVNANIAVEERELEIELYKLKEQINQLFFGMLLIDAQIKQAEILKKDIRAGMDKNKTAIANGIALKSSGDLLVAELLKVDQKTGELKMTRSGYAAVLSLFINQVIDEHSILEKPTQLPLPKEITRPELQWFDLKKSTLAIQSRIINQNTLPRFSFFVQGGYGRPGLNMLNNEFEFYYTAGVRLRWNIANFYDRFQEKQLLLVRQSILDVHKETLLFNINRTLKLQKCEIEKREELIKTDIELIRLRQVVKQSAQNQLEFGATTINDYLICVRAEDAAKQNLIIHELELLLAQYNFKVTAGN